jgi:signal transduction histidine kinase
MSEIATALESRNATVAGGRKRLMLLAELAWELREIDPQRSESLATDVARQARDVGMEDIEAIAGVIALAHPEMQREPDRSGKLEASLSNEPLWLARLLDLLAREAVRRDDYSAALAFLLRALAIAEQSGDRARAADTLDRIGWVHYLAGRFDDALAFAERSLVLCDEIENRAGISEALNTIATIHYVTGDYSGALEKYTEALAIREEVGGSREIGGILDNIGLVHNALGEHSDALAYHRRALAIREELGEPETIARSHSHIGNVHIPMGEYAEAIEHYRQALGIQEEAGIRRHVATSFLNIGNVHAALGEQSEALEHYRRALVISEEIGDRRGVATLLNNIGGTFADLGDDQRALEEYRKSLSIREELGDRLGISSSLTNIGDALYTLGDYPGALENSCRALAIQREIGYRIGALNSAATIGLTFLAQGELAEAIGTLVDVVAEAEEIGARDVAARVHADLVDAFERVGDDGRALAHLREHLRLKEEMRIEETSREIRKLDARRRISEAEKEAEIERLRNVELAAALRQLRETQALLVQSEKMAGIGQLTAGIAHEINNPINYVSASLPSLRRDLDQLQVLLSPNPGCDEEAAEVIEEMQQLLRASLEGARRVSEIVAGLRSFTRLDESDIKPVDLHEGLDATIALLGSRLQERIMIHRDYGNLPPVRCYPAQINQVFMNILSNAIMAIDGEGAIRIRSEVVGNDVSITIADTGVGMTPEVQTRIFEPFFTTRDVGEGRGLGLSIAWGIVEKHGGTIEVRSAPGEGSTLTILLPVASGD